MAATQDEPLMKGMLTKRAVGKTATGRKNWKDRFFVLTPTELQYWDRIGGRHNPDASKKGEIALAEVRAVQEVDENCFRRPFVLQVVFESYVLYAQAQDKQDRDNWIQALRTAIANNPKLAVTFHPGCYDGKWSCCNSGSRTADGCQPTSVFSSTNSTAPAAPTVSNGSAGSAPPSLPLPPIPYDNGAAKTATITSTSSRGSTSTLQSTPLPPTPTQQAAVSSPAPPTPPAPRTAEPSNPGFEVIAMFAHVATEPTDLSINVGDKLTIMDCTEQHWWKARNAQGQTGFVPRNYVRRLGIESEPWYHGKISRPEAAALLRMANQEGCFLVRDSESKAGEYSLSVSHGESLRHYHIKYQDGMYFIHERHRFPDITQLIEYHKLNSGGLVTRLRKSVNDLNAPVTSGLGHEKYEIDPSEITFGKELGSGQFGRVLEGQFRNGTKIAIKMMKEGAMSEDDFIAEAKIMKNLSHPNLVQLYGVCTRTRPIYIVTELMTQGCLLDYLRNNSWLNAKPEIIHYMCIQVSKAMVFLEQHGFIHRDLAARNCLISDNNVVKVADFGLARFVLDDEYTASQGTKFPIKWAAPEVIQYARFSTKSDVWSYGILMWELWTLGHVPYPTLSNLEVIDKVVEGHRLARPPAASHQVHQLMLDCWHHDPDYRPTFTEVARRLEENKGDYEEN
eukprot:m.23829 g.23829  ORF g.23829 m.23829 type:complete len:677 (-) comp11095_c0_seq1:50-2080(-)